MEKQIELNIDGIRVRPMVNPRKRAKFEYYSPETGFWVPISCNDKLAREIKNRMK